MLFMGWGLYHGAGARANSATESVPLQDYAFHRTVGILAVSGAESTLYQVGTAAEITADSTLFTTFVALHRLVAPYQSRFVTRPARLTETKGLERTLLFISPETTLEIVLGPGWLGADDVYAVLASEDYNVLENLLAQSTALAQANLAGHWSTWVSDLQADYQGAKRPLPFSQGEVIETGYLAQTPETRAVIEVEANNIVLADGQPEGSTEALKLAKPTQSPVRAQGQSKKVDTLVIREQAPKIEDPTVHVQLAPGGEVIDARVKRSETKGDEAGVGSSGRLLQWAYSFGGAIVFLGFVAVLNRVANKMS